MKKTSLEFAQNESDPVFDGAPEELDGISLSTNPDGTAELNPKGGGQRKTFVQMLFHPNSGMRSKRLNKMLVFFTAVILTVAKSWLYMSLTSAIAAGVVVLISYYCIVEKSDAQNGAAVYFPAIAFVSALLSMIVQTVPILSSFDYQVYLAPISSYWVALVALSAFILFVCKANWVGDLSGAILAFVFAFILYSGDSLIRLSDYASAWSALRAVLLVNAIWVGLRQFSRVASGGGTNRAYRTGKWLGAILVPLGIMRILCFPTRYDVVPLLAEPLSDGLGGILSWQTAVVLAGVFQLFAMIMYHFELRRFTYDSESMTICGWLVLLARYADEMRFPFCWTLLLAVALCYMCGFSNRRDDVLGLRKEAFYPGLFLLSGLGMYLLNKDKWLIVLILLLFLWAIRSAYNGTNISDEKLSAFRWVLVLACSCVGSVAVLWLDGFSLPAVTFLLSELAFSSVVVVAINLWRTDKRGLLRDNAIICALSSAVMLLTAARSL